MPRLKRFRFSATPKPKRRPIALPPPPPDTTTNGTLTTSDVNMNGDLEDDGFEGDGGPGPGTLSLSAPISCNGVNSTVSMPMTMTSASTPKTTAASTTSVIMMSCVVCYNEYAFYSLQCAPWESAVTKDFYTALNIPSLGEDSVTALPFCPECHSKVAVMYSLHQQLQNILQNFNCIRNDLAFAMVESVKKGLKDGAGNSAGRKGPLDIIRQQIYDRWKDLYSKSKEVGDSSLYDPKSTFEYLKPKLSVVDEFPIDSKSMTMSQEARKRLHDMRRTPASTLAKKRTVNRNNLGDVGSPVKREDMPVLEPMGVVRKSPASSRGPGRIAGGGGPFLSGFPKNKGRRDVFTKKLPVKMKPLAGPIQSKRFLPNATYHRKPIKRLENGLWKCNYCPVSYENRVAVSQHESRCHPQTRPYLCSECPKGFLTLDGLRKHWVALHPNLMSTSNNESFESFPEEGHKPGTVKCPQCPRFFGKRQAFEKHFKAFHKGKKVPLLIFPSYGKTPLKPKPKPMKAQAAPRKKSVPLPKGSPPSPEITDITSPPTDLKKKISPEASPVKKNLIPLPIKKRRGSSQSKKLKQTDAVSMVKMEPETEAKPSTPMEVEKIVAEGEHDKNNGNADSESQVEQGESVDGQRPSKRPRRSASINSFYISPRTIKMKKRLEVVICSICEKKCMGAQGLATHMKSHNRHPSGENSSKESEGGEEEPQKIGDTQVKTEGAQDDENTAVSIVSETLDKSDMEASETVAAAAAVSGGDNLSSEVRLNENIAGEMEEKKEPDIISSE